MGKPNTTWLKTEPPLTSPSSSASLPISPSGYPSDIQVLRMIARVLRNMEGVTSKNSERLLFLDPELKSTLSRIEVLEISCQANSEKIDNLNTDLATVQICNDRKNLPWNKDNTKCKKEIRTNNYFHSSKIRETSRLERLSSKETNTKYIIERANYAPYPSSFSADRNEYNTIPRKYRSYENVSSTWSGGDDVFLEKGSKRHKSDSAIQTRMKGDPRTPSFLKSSWGYEDVPMGVPSSGNKTSWLNIGHEPTDECYIST